ncbi:class I SAM-dependent methyltransferase [Paenibacillus sp. 1001270B_150601_E10]|uniref:class I SAM-dependent methyltransferase n=1 Tax=Paenibacillus sp. 1001270B_150601_E10 TaxID=2787079 RepID=UPI0018A0FEDF|nr:class I SAM-dependent methyltransferase [Paenibacillus sp. 1001270B_150601_E10]
MPNHEEIYRHDPKRYHEMIAKQPDLRKVIQDIVHVEGKDIVDLGAGTGRLTASLAPLSRSIIALDQSEAMLELNRHRLSALGLDNWKTQLADHRQLPLQDQCADLVTAGWSICYLAAADRPDWEHSLQLVMNEIHRILRPDGTVIIIETMGTGTTEPSPPSFLQPYYHALEHQYGFASSLVRTDYQFANVEEAFSYISFFFGDELAEQLLTQQLATVMEWAGIWWRKGRMGLKEPF